MGFLLTVPVAPAATRNWDGDTSTAWGTAANWDTLPADDINTDIANFNLATYGGNPVYAPSSGTRSIAGITIGAANGAMTLTTGTTPGLSIGTNGITMASGAGALTVPAASVVTIGAAQSWVNNSANAVTLNGALSGSAGLTLAGTGAGGFTLTADNTGYTGATTINKATLTLSGANGAIAAGTGSTLYNRGTLTIDNTTTKNNRLGGQAFTSYGGTFNFNNPAAGQTESIGTMTLNAGALTINTGQNAGNSTLTISSFSRAAGGTVFISGTGLGTAANQVQLTTAPTFVNNILPYGLMYDGTTYNLINTFANGGSINAYTAYDTSTGAPTWGTTTNARPGIAGITLAGAKSLNSLVLDNGVNFNAPTATSAITIGSATQAGLIVQTGGTSTIDGGSTTLRYTFAFGTREAIFNTIGTLNIVPSATANTQLSSTAGGTLTKTGSGTLQLGTDARNDFRIGNMTTLNLNQGLFDIYAVSANALNSFTSAINLNGGNLTVHAITDMTYSNPLNGNADGTITLDRRSGSPGVGKFAAFGNLTVANTPNLTLTAGANVTSGTEQLTAGTVTLNSSVTFTLNNSASGTIKLLVGGITDNGNSITLKGNGQFAQQTAGWTGTGGLILHSTYSGTATLDQVNTYSGNTTVDGGTLTLTGSGTIDSSPVITVASGASLTVSGVTGGYQVKSGQTLTGAGTVTGGITLNGGASVNPGGVGTVGMLVITGTVAFSSSSTNVVDISGTTADRLAVTGAVSIASGAVIRFSGTPSSGTTYTLLTAASGITGSPAFTTDNLPGGWELSYNVTNLTLAESAREIDVRGNGVSITNNDSTPVVADHTDFGPVAVPGSSNIVRTFAIYNTGTASLSLTGTPLVVVGGAHSNDFTVTLNPTNSVAAGTSTTFQVTFDPSAAGARTGTLSIANNDTDENPYVFAILGTGLASTGPEMDVEGNTVSIADGDSTPASADHTDFGAALPREGTVVRTFTIRNLGDLTLNLTGTPPVVLGGAHSNDFSVTLAPSNQVAPGTSTTFQVTFDPSALGVRTGTVSIACDDADENPYNFTIQGTGALYTWNVATGLWNTAANWIPTGVPSTNDDAFITNGGMNDLDVTAAVVSNLTVGSGSTLRKDNSTANRTLTVDGVLTNAGTVTHNQGSNFLTLSLSTSASNANNGTIRADGREFRFAANGWRLNNSGGVIEAVNGGYLNFSNGGTVTNGVVTIDATSTSQFTRVNETLTFSSVGINNAGTFQMLGASSSKTLIFSTSGGLTNAGTAKVSNSGTGVNQSWTFNSGTILDNRGTLTIENIRTDTLATSQSYLDLKAGSSLTNSGTIVVTSLTNTYGTAQLRSTNDLTNAGTITVDGSSSSIQMAGKTLTQTAGTNDIKNGGSVLATNVLINGGTLAGDGAITGNVTLATGVTRAWSFTNGVAGVMSIAGTLTLPTSATVAVSGGGAFPNPATVFTATVLTGAVNLAGWTITGTNGYAAAIVGNSVVLAVPAMEMDVRGNGLSITNGDNTPVVSDNTDFGSVGVTGASNVLAFTIHNLGTLPLSLTGTPTVAVGGAHSNDFTVILAPSNQVAAGSSTTFQISFDPSAVGVRTGTVSIVSDDADENPYSFSIQGSGTGSSAPEMDVEGNAVSIADGANTPTASNHTDFGVALVSGATVVRTFTVRNLGDLTLNLTGTPVVVVGGTHSNDFAVTLAPSSSVAPGSSTTFQVTFDPAAIGLRSATLLIANDDADENPYDFAIQGTGAVYTWNVATGLWNTAANWNPIGVPSASDDAFITNGGTNDLNVTASVSNLTVGSGSALRKDNTGTDRTLSIDGVLTNAGTIAHNQGSSGFLSLSLLANTRNVNTGTIRGDGREIRLACGTAGAWTLNNAGGTIEAVNGGYVNFNAAGTITNGFVTIDVASTSQFTRANASLTFSAAEVHNAGTFQMLGTANSRNLSFLTSGGLTNAGTAKVSISGTGVDLGWTFNSGTRLDNSGTFTIENLRTNTAATSESYLDLAAGSSFINSGTIAVTSLTNTYGTAQLRAAINLTNAGTITVDGPQSSIQMTNRTLTQTAGTLDIKSGGYVVATNVLINGGILAGNGSITGNVTLATGVTRAWSFTNGVAGSMSIAGTLTLPTVATVAVSGAGDLPSPATVFTATLLDGASTLSGWSVTGASGYGARIVGNHVVLVPQGGTVFKFR